MEALCPLKWPGVRVPWEAAGHLSLQELWALGSHLLAQQGTPDPSQGAPVTDKAHRATGKGKLFQRPRCIFSEQTKKFSLKPDVDKLVTSDIMGLGCYWPVNVGQGHAPVSRAVLHREQFSSASSTPSPSSSYKKP